MSIWFTFLYQPLINVLMFMYQALGSNLGLAIIATTILIRLLLIPLTTPGMKSAAKMQELKPELDKLKKNFGKDAQSLAQAQLALYREHNINPMGSLLPTILQFMLLIAMFQAFNNTLKTGTDISQINPNLYPFIQIADTHTLNTRFLYFDLTAPDTFKLNSPLALGPIKIDQVPGIMLLLAAAVQFISSYLMMPAKKKDEKKNTGEDPKSDDMMASMQKQMLFLGPINTPVS